LKINEIDAKRGVEKAHRYTLFDSRQEVLRTIRLGPVLIPNGQFKLHFEKIEREHSGKLNIRNPNVLTTPFLTLKSAA